MKQEVVTVGLDLAKNVFQIHSIGAGGEVLVRRKLRRAEVLPFFTELPNCLVGMDPRHGAINFNFDRDIFAHRAVGDHRHERRTWFYGGSTRRYRVAQLAPPSVMLRGANFVPPGKRGEIITTLRLRDDRQPLPQSAIAARWSENSAYA